jgi:hypothetical protein
MIRLAAVSQQNEFIDKLFDPPACDLDTEFISSAGLQGKPS